MINNALKLKSPTLAQKTADYDEAKLRSLAAQVAQAAITRHHLEQPEIKTGLAALETHTYGDQDLITDLSNLADRIEAPYVAALDRGEDVTASRQLMAQFEQARAVTALYLALDTDIARDGGNAVYEALYAGVPEEEILQLLVA